MSYTKVTPISELNTVPLLHLGQIEQEIEARAANTGDYIFDDTYHLVYQLEEIESRLDPKTAGYKRVLEEIHNLFSLMITYARCGLLQVTLGDYPDSRPIHLREI